MGKMWKTTPNVVVRVASRKLETQQLAVGFRGLCVNPRASQSAATSKTDGQLCNQINKFQFGKELLCLAHSDASSALPRLKVLPSSHLLPFPSSPHPYFLPCLFSK
jgi:hypothetical protein